MGTIFSLTKDGGSYTVLHSFSRDDDSSDWSSRADLVEGRDGVLYGTTYNDGDHEFGTVFSLNEDGTGFTILYRFTGRDGDNAGSSADLAIGVDGTLYGTTSQDGDLGQGTLFRLFYSPPRIVITRIELGATGARLSLSGRLAGKIDAITLSARPTGISGVGDGSAQAKNEESMESIDRWLRD